MLRSTMRLLLPGILCLSLFSSCSLTCTQGEGPVVDDHRKLDRFDRIQLNFDARISIHKGDVPGLVIHAQGNLQNEIVAKESGGKLELNSESCMEVDEPVRIEITVPDLRELEVTGSGDIVLLDTFMVETIELSVTGSGSIHGRLVAARIESEVTGSGDIVLEGSANEQVIDITGSGDVKAMALPCNTADVDVTGSGDAYLYVIKQLDAEVSGSGTVHYKGKPEMKSEVNGSGKVVDDN